MAEVRYYLSRLEKVIPESSARLIDVAWIPSAYAVKGKTVKIRKKDGSWENGWRVVSVADGPIDEKRAESLYTCWKAFREFTYAGRSSYKEKTKRARR
jgi:hypothetical protein